MHTTHVASQTYHTHTTLQTYCTHTHIHTPVYTVHSTHTTLQTYHTHTALYTLYTPLTRHYRHTAHTHTHTHTPQASGVEPAQLPLLVPPRSSCVTCLCDRQTPHLCFPRLLPFTWRPCHRLPAQGCVRSCCADTAPE